MCVTLEVLHVPDCPSLLPMLQRLRVVTDLPVTTREITTDGDAAAAGMNGPPTLLMDGVDPFAEPGQAPSVSCLYRDETGNPTGAPSTTQLRAALDLPVTPAAATIPAAALAEQDCCNPAQNTPSSSAESPRTWRARTSRPTQAAHDVHQAILRAFPPPASPRPTRSPGSRPHGAPEAEARDVRASHRTSPRVAARTRPRTPR